MLLRFFGNSINEKHLTQITDTLRKDGVIVLPTDTVYALACDIHNNKAVDRISRLKNTKIEKANFSFLCADLSNISEFTTPFSTEIFPADEKQSAGTIYFILNANNNVPSIFRSNKRTIGIRVPDNPLAQAIVRQLGNPLMVTSVHGDDEIRDYLTDPEEIEDHFGERVDIVIDAGSSTNEPSTVIDCTGSEPVVIREGKGVLI